MKRFAILLALLFLPLSVSAQTSVAVPVQNPSFEILGPPLIYGYPGSGFWSADPIPGWNAWGYWNCGDSWQPGPMAFSSIPDGKTVALTNGEMRQDLGIIPEVSKQYKLSVYTGNRADANWDNAASWEIALYVGPTEVCSLSGPNSAIPRGGWVKQTLVCPMPANLPSGNLIIGLGNSLENPTNEAAFDEVTLTVGDQVPKVTLALESSNVKFDDGTPYLQNTTGTISELESGVWANIGSIAVDGDGHLAGTITIDPNFADSADNLAFLIAFGGSSVIPSFQIKTGSLQHDSTGFHINIVFFKADGSVKDTAMGLLPSCDEKEAECSDRGSHRRDP